MPIERKVRAADETRCRWPECSCYSAQGPQECKRQLCVYTNSTPGEAWNAAYAAPLPPEDGK